MANKFMYISNVNTQNYNNWLKRLGTQLNKATNQSLFKVPKVVKSTNKNILLSNFGTSVIKSQLSPPPHLSLNQFSPFYTWTDFTFCLIYNTKQNDVYLSVCMSDCLPVCLSVCLSVFLSVCLSVCPSVCPSVCLSLRILVTTEPIGFYSSGNIPAGPVVVLGYFLGVWGEGVQKI